MDDFDHRRVRGNLGIFSIFGSGIALGKKTNKTLLSSECVHHTNSCNKDLICESGWRTVYKMLIKKSGSMSVSVNCVVLKNKVFIVHFYVVVFFMYNKNN